MVSNFKKLSNKLQRQGKSKESANTLLYTIQQNHLPGRVVEEY